MRIVTWNVDGIRAMLQRRQESLASVLQKLNADIVCLQETKLSKADLGSIQDFAIVPGWQSFFGMCRLRANYAGVATFCKRETCVVTGAEEGLCGRGTDAILLKGTGVQRPPQDAWQSLPEASILHNDEEGRCMITDHGKFILVHLYGPAVTDIHAERFPRKLDFYKALEIRMDHWLELGRHVLILGDLNIAWQPIDNCDWADSKLPPDKLKEAFLRDRPDRKWFQAFLDPARDGAPRDLLRKFHPSRRKAYTVWGRTYGKRERNFGSRVDYILSASPSPSSTSPQGEASKFTDMCTGCDILVDWQGSDHAPVFADFDLDFLEARAESTPARTGLELESRMRYSAAQRTQPTIAAMFSSAAKQSRKRKAQELQGSETPPRPGEF